ncbi:chlorohydrolase [Streptococcus pneumoniae]|nr:chlorohydrolase [Streptococcus pneumoniae]
MKLTKSMVLRWQIELTNVSSRHCFEVADRTDEVSLKHCFEVADETDEV